METPDGPLRFKLWWLIVGHYNDMGIVPPGGMVEQMVDRALDCHQMEDRTMCA